MTGIFWYLDYPKDLYNLKYFKFHRPVGGHANDGPILKIIFITKSIQRFRYSLNALIQKYPFSRCLFRFNENEKLIIFTIAEYCLYDYDFLFAIEVEKLIEQNAIEFLEQENQSNLEFKRLEGEGIRSLSRYYFKSNFIRYNTLGHSGAFGSSMLAIVIDMINLDSKRTPMVLEHLKIICIECELNYLWVNKTHFKNKDFITVFATNGRQGLNFTPYKIGDLKLFESKTIDMFEHYNLLSEIETQSYDEYKEAYPDDRTPTDLIKLLGNTDTEFEKSS